MLNDITAPEFTSSGSDWTAWDPTSSLQDIRRRSEAWKRANTLHAQMETLLGSVSNPDAQGAQTLSFQEAGWSYQVRQSGPGKDIEISLEKAGTPANQFSSDNLWKIQLHPDGHWSASSPQTKKKWQPRQQAFHVNQVQHFLQEQHANLKESWKAFQRLHQGLQKLQGSYHAQDRSLWYEKFVVLKDRVFSFKIENRNLPGTLANPRFYRITIYEETPQARQKIFSLSSTGEYGALNQEGLKRIPSIGELAWLKEMETHLESALRHPSRYETQLCEKLRALNPHWISLPKVLPKLILPQTTTTLATPQGAILLHIDSGWDLWRLVRPFNRGKRWESPENQAETRQVRPNFALRRVLYQELGRWMGRSSFYGVFSNLFSLRPKPDSLRLHLYPDGSGQLNVYRDGALSNLLDVDGRGETFNLKKQISAKAKGDPAFAKQPHAEQIHQVLEKISEPEANSPTPTMNAVAPITPEILQQALGEASRKYQSPDRPLTVFQISREIQALPQLRGLKLQEHASHRHYKLDEQLWKPKVYGLQLEFPQSQAPLKISIHEFTRADGQEYRHEVLVQQGGNLLGMTLENGRLTEQPPYQAFEQAERLAKEGHVYRPWPLLLTQRVFRVAAYVRVNGLVYVGASLISLPFEKIFDSMFFSAAEQSAFARPLDFSASNLAQRAVGLLFLLGASGGTAVLIDGFYNFREEFSKVLRASRQGTGLLTAYKHYRPGSLNPEPNLRPVGNRWLMRGALQRCLPLLVGVAALDTYETGSIDWRKLRNVSLVSLASSGILQLGLRNLRFAQAAENARLIERSVHVASPWRHSLTFRGNLLVAGIEFFALHVIDSAEQRYAYRAMKAALQISLRQAIEQRNELISLLEQGVSVPPQELHWAELRLHRQVLGYRDFLAQFPTPPALSAARLPLGSAIEESRRKHQERMAALSQSGELTWNRFSLSADLEYQGSIAEHLSRHRKTRLAEQESLRESGVEALFIPEDQSLLEFIRHGENVLRGSEGEMENDSDQQALIAQVNADEIETPDKVVASTLEFSGEDFIFLENAEGFQGQIEDYYARSNERMALAFEALSTKALVH